MNYGTMSSAMRRLMTAREKVARRSEWFGGIIYAAPLVEWRDKPTMATDGIKIYANPDFVKENDPFIEGVFLHETLHIALDHVSRRKWRKPRLWNMACDYAINPLVKRLFPLPGAEINVDSPPGTKGHLYDPRFNGMRAEAIYEVLEQEQKQRPKPPEGDFPMPNDDEGEGDGDGDIDGDFPTETEGEGKGRGKPSDDDEQDDQGDGEGDQADDEADEQDDDVGSKGKGKDEDKEKSKSEDEPSSGDMLEPPSQEELDKARAKMRDAVSRSTDKCEKAGTMKSDIRAALKEFVPSEKLDWRKVLDEWARNARDNVSLTWRRPNRRSIGNGDYRPGYEQTKIHKLVACIDCSGSINDEWAKEMKAELISLVNQGLVNTVHLIATDTDICNEAEVTTAEEIEAFEVGRGGGTDFDAAMQRVGQITDAMGCVFLTDMQTCSFGRDPDMPVIWVDWTKYANQKVPFGKVCAL
jgi:predicted metal-dependent peptidase